VSKTPTLNVSDSETFFSVGNLGQGDRQYIIHCSAQELSTAVCLSYNIEFHVSEEGWRYETSFIPISFHVSRRFRTVGQIYIM
jgi:hypothetical protein